MNEQLKARLRAIRLALDDTVASSTWRTLPLPTSEHFDERFRGRSDEAIVLDCLRGSFKTISRVIGFSIRRDDPDVADARDAFIYSSMLLQCWVDETDEHVERVLPSVTGLVSERPPVFSGLAADSSTALSVVVFGAVMTFLSRAANGESVGSLESIAGQEVPRLHEGLIRVRSTEIMSQVANVLAPLPWPELSSAVRIEMALLVGRKTRRQEPLGRVTSPQADAHAFNLKLHQEYPKVVGADGELTENAARVLSVLPVQGDEEVHWMTEGQIVDALGLLAPDIVKKVMPGLGELKLIRREKGKKGACRTTKGTYVLARQRLAIDWTDVVGGTGSGTD